MAVVSSGLGPRNPSATRSLGTREIKAAAASAYTVTRRRSWMTNTRRSGLRRSSSDCADMGGLTLPSAPIPRDRADIMARPDGKLHGRERAGDGLADRRGIHPRQLCDPEG